MSTVQSERFTAAFCCAHLLSHPYGWNNTLWAHLFTGHLRFIYSNRCISVIHRWFSQWICKYVCVNFNKSQNQRRRITISRQYDMQRVCSTQVKHLQMLYLIMRIEKMPLPSNYDHSTDNGALSNFDLLVEAGCCLYASTYHFVAVCFFTSLFCVQRQTKC